MAELVLGLGTSHTPMLSLDPQYWHLMGEADKNNPELVSVPGGELCSYEELLERADPNIPKHISLEKFEAKHKAIQKAIATLTQTLEEAAPDVAVIISDDQDELLFEDNMPTYSIFWGDNYPLMPYNREGSDSPIAQALAAGWGDVEKDVPVDSGLGRHIIEYMMEAEVDVAQFRRFREDYGGSVARLYPSVHGRESSFVKETPPRPFTMPHGFSFVIKRIMKNNPIPIVPLFQNIYPPNQPTTKRAFNIGRALRGAIESWDTGKRVAVIASGGLSHFVVDEELDQMALKGMQEKDPEQLYNLPRHRLNSAASEIRNWIVASGATEHLDMEILDYVPVYRSPAGTGGGWAFARWQ